MDLEWKTKKKEKVLDAKIFSVYLAERSYSDGREGIFAEIASPDWVVIIPVISEGGKDYFVMVDQWRHGSESVTREFPAGIVEKGEEAVAAAERELLEETGMTGNFKFLGNVCPNNAIMSNRQSFFLAKKVKKVKEQNLDKNENIDIVKIPVAEAVEKMGTFPYDNGVMMGALAFYMRSLNKKNKKENIYIDQKQVN